MAHSTFELAATRWSDTKSSLRLPPALALGLPARPSSRPDAVAASARRSRGMLGPGGWQGVCWYFSPGWSRAQVVLSAQVPGNLTPSTAQPPVTARPGGRTVQLRDFCEANDAPPDQLP